MIYTYDVIGLHLIENEQKWKKCMIIIGVKYFCFTPKCVVYSI